MTARALSRLYSKALAKHGLESTEFTLLCAFDKRPLDTLTDLAGFLDLERTTLVRNAKRLAEKGLITAARRSGGGITYAVTAAGKKKLNEARPSWQIVQEQVAAELGRISGGDIVRILNHLRNIGKPDSS